MHASTWGLIFLVLERMSQQPSGDFSEMLTVSSSKDCQDRLIWGFWKWLEPLLVNAASQSLVPLLYCNKIHIIWPMPSPTKQPKVSHWETGWRPAHHPKKATYHQWKFSSSVHARVFESQRNADDLFILAKTNFLFYQASKKVSIFPLKNSNHPEDAARCTLVPYHQWRFFPEGTFPGQISMISLSISLSKFFYAKLDSPDTRNLYSP